jgi:hypothetical protein
VEKPPGYWRQTIPALKGRQTKASVRRPSRAPLRHTSHYNSPLNALSWDNLAVSHTRPHEALQLALERLVENGWQQRV